MKMRKLLKSQKGSSFAYILVVVSILLILTGTLITMTVANYRLGLIKGGRNTAFYFADGAIDVALAQIEELSHRAEIAASNVVQDENADFRKSDEWVKFEKWLEKNTQPEVDDNLEGNKPIESNGASKDSNKKVYLTVEEASALYSEAINKEFQKQYLLFLMEADRVKDDYKLIEKDKDSGDDVFVHENNMTFISSEATLNTKFLTALQTSKFKPTGSESFDEIQASITSVEPEYRKDNQALRLKIQTGGKYNIYNKGVEVVVDMVPPRYNYITVTDMVRKEMYTNDILENALTAKGDIIIVDGDVQTFGDVYALGTFKDAIANDDTGKYSDSINHLNKGGVIVGYNKDKDNFLNLTDGSIDLTGKAALEVNGNIKTVASLKTGYTGASINVIEDKTNNLGGYVYTDSYVTPTHVDQTKLDVQTSMFVMDDVYINGDNTSITIGTDTTYDSSNNNTNIDDTIMTFLDGGVLDPGVAGDVRVSPDLSSSIRVSKESQGTKISADYLYVPGVAYIDVFRTVGEGDDRETKFYKTGESFTTEKNFFFYQKEYEEQEERTTNVEYTDGETTFSLVEYIDETGEINDSPYYKAEHFLNSVRDEYNKPEDIRDDEIVASSDKSIMTLHSIKQDPSSDDEGDQNTYENNYTLGVFMANKRIYNPRRLGLDAATYITDFRNPSNSISDVRMHLLGFRDYTHGTLKTTTSVEGKDVDMFSQYIDFEKAKDYTTLNTSGLLVTVTDKDVYINTGKTVSGAILYEGSNTIRGLVATKGNIYIYNNDANSPLTFKGSLIAGGDIILYGSGKKIIDNIDEAITIDQSNNAKGVLPLQSRALVYQTVGTSNTLMDTFHTKSGRKLIVNLLKGNTGYTRSIFYNLSLSIVDKDYDYYEGKYDGDSVLIPPHTSVGTVDITMSSTPELDGMIKEKELKGYELVYWREIKPSN
jgi:hypothetical protein